MSGRCQRLRNAAQMDRDGIKTLRPSQRVGHCGHETYRDEVVGIFCHKAPRYATPQGVRCFEHARPALARAAVSDLSGYAHGHDTIIEGCDLIDADIDAENARQMGDVR